MQQPTELKIPFDKTIMRFAGNIEVGGWKRSSVRTGPSSSAPEIMAAKSI